MIKNVHVVFKTHLDIGFTDLAENVVDQYVNTFIPKALTLANELQTTSENKKFVWTTGSWLIHYYLQHASTEEREKMENAIRNGDIAWHGFPYTTHTELLNTDLLNYGLSLSNNLDKRFNRETIAAKMTDVPGHSIAMVPQLVEHGIQYLHIGVNPTSKVPAVPKLFRWRAEKGVEIIVNYASSYGEVVQVDGLEDVMVFAHTGDNNGPPSIDEIHEQFSELQDRFPGAKIFASTLDAFAKKLVTVKEKLPVVTEEIGDTWIHGAGTDPYKLACYRELVRLRSQWLQEGSLQVGSKAYEGLSENLMLIAEHTWGMDLKEFLPDYRHYDKSSFQQAREKDSFGQEAVPLKYKYISGFMLDEIDEHANPFQREQKSYSYRVFESSWQEQRDYIKKAIEALDDDKKSIANRKISNITAAPVIFNDQSTCLNVNETYNVGQFLVSFSSEGSIDFLQDSTKKIWADHQHVLGLYSYETFGVENYHHWFRNYMRDLPSTHPWADSDFGKPGFEYTEPTPTYAIYKPTVRSIRLQKDQGMDKVQIGLVMPEAAVADFGAPANITIEYGFDHKQPKLSISLYWQDKESNRLPEASWFSFSPIVENPNRWLLHKLGTYLSPLDVVKDGNRNLHAIEKGVLYEAADGRIEIDSMDAALVSPGQRKLLQFDNAFAPMDGGMHMNLHNNKWGTNFPMWYEDDAKFRFYLTFQSKR